MIGIRPATAAYEKWLGKQLTLLPDDLRKKHAAMARDSFSFFRATFYRWTQVWQQVGSADRQAPAVLAVGDLHVENFGTWRDVEGRLVWGVNDFDEAYELPYVFDLVRLATSAHLAVRESHFCVRPRDACDAILDGYREGLENGGLPLVLAEKHRWLRNLCTGALRDPELFWAKMRTCAPLELEAVPSGARKAMERMLPSKNIAYKCLHRIAGLGSLGRERYVALAAFEGALVAREAKALAPSACAWAGLGKSQRIRYQEILDQAVRAADPFVRLKQRWVVRRLAPDCSRIQLATMPRERDEAKLLHTMGFETANIHLGTKKAVRPIRADLAKRPHRWLHRAAAAMEQAVLRDWEAYRKP